jgi:Cu+-exporting ATPase
MENQTTQHIEWNVQGMTCTNCALGIRQYLEKEGLQDVSVDFGAGEVQFEIVNPAKLPALRKGIEQLGYKVVLEDEEEGMSYLSKLEWLFGICALFTIPLLLHMVLPFHLLHNPWFQLAMASPVYLIGMYHFGRSAIRSLRTGIPNMDVLVALGATAAFFYSLYGVINSMGEDFLFFETAASIITIVLLGNVMEQRSVRRTTSAIRELMDLRKTTARRVVIRNGKEVIEEVEAARIRKTDILQLNSGDRVAVDGTLISGQAEIDESMISGESLPVSVNAGAFLTGGTLLVEGNLRMEATAVGTETVLSKIIALVKKAQADKPDIQQLADKVSAIFVPAVVAIALVTFVLSLWVFGLSLQASLIHSVAVLVIACPCAMGLATPTAVIVGIGRASKSGILIKGGHTLELIQKIRTVVFDKTGTLTNGEFLIRDIHCDPGIEDEVRAALAGLEQHSSHPIAQSLVKALHGTQPISMVSVSERKGLGVEGIDENGNQYEAGSWRIASGLTRDDTHAVYLIKNGNLIGMVDLQDQIRPGAKEAVQFLIENGIEPVMLSGDSEEKCMEVARELGIEQVFARKLPDEKLTIIEQFHTKGPVAMVGDGINDAPALAKASLGISLGKATAIAMQSAEVLLLRDELSGIKDLFGIGKHTVRTIKQNLFWAFIYNILAIPLAAFGFLSPIIAAFSMAFSDLIVVGNSLRLKFKRIE